MAYKSFMSVSGGSGNLNGNVAGTQVGGNRINMDDVLEMTLSAQFDLTPATATLQMFGEWQISDDGVTWRDVKIENAALAVVMATGTAAISRTVLPAPAACYGARFCRAVVRNTVATGAAGDLYALTYRYQNSNY
jgi:hypothetical protein